MTIGECRLVLDPRIGGNNRPARMRALARTRATDPGVSSPLDEIPPVATAFAQQKQSAALTVISTRDRHQSPPPTRRMRHRRQMVHRVRSIGFTQEARW